MDSLNKVEYKIRDLGTRSVTLFPTKAQIWRQIKDVALKPGANEITIVGLSPTVDEHSIKVEGTGSAIITDIAVETLPNRERYDDVYPSSEDETDDDITDDGDDYGKKPAESPQIKAVDVRIKNFKAERKRAEEDIANARSRSEILNSWTTQLDKKKQTVNIGEALSTYNASRQKLFNEEQEARSRSEELLRLLNIEEGERRRLKKIEAKANAHELKEKRKAEKTKAKERANKQNKLAERKMERERVKTERESFWPKNCFTVRITLEANAYTPMSSRRNSVSSDVDLAKFPAEKSSDSPAEEAPTCDLLLSYVTTSAYWSPSYDLQISTTSASGTLCFDAQLRNSTSETWENCKVTLSTTQSTFSGLEDTIPSLQPWHIKLAANKNAGHSDSGVLNSAEERGQRAQYLSQQQIVNLPKPREQMFGKVPNHALTDYQTQLMLLEQQNKKRLMMASHEAHNQPQQMQMQQPMQAITASARARKPPVEMARQHLQQPMQMMQSMPPPPAPAGGASHEPEGGEFSFGGFMGDTDTLAADMQPNLDYQESLVEETGFTTTYDLPGLKTLAPKSTVSKQRVARISFPNVGLSHIVVAKYRPVAYLKAKLRNGSKLTLLRGPTGLTLDGSFMGRTTLPRCSSGDTFSLSLGVDPAIKAIYSKPDVRRSTTGMFSKENSSVYTRTLILQNTRASAGKPVALTVLDQVPVSEDERLKVQVVSPHGMSIGGGSVPTGKPGRDIPEDKVWGKASVAMKKSGEVSWDVNLNAGKAVKLGLEYVVALPSGDFAVEC